MEIMNYEDTLDAIINALKDNAENTTVPADNVHESVNNPSDWEHPTPFITVAGVPGAPITLEGYAEELEVIIFIGAEQQIDGATALRTAMTIAAKVAKVINSLDLMTKAQGHIELANTFSDTAVVALRYTTPFLFAEV